MLKGFITIKEASEIYGKNMSSIRRKIKSKEWIDKCNRKANVLIEEEDAFLIGNTWIVKKERLDKIYGSKR